MFERGLFRSIASRTGASWKRIAGAPIVVSVAIAAVAAIAASNSQTHDEVHGGPVTYFIPKAYRAISDSLNGMYMQVRFADWGPLERDVPGWEDNINILVTMQRSPIALLFDTLWDGTPKTKMRGSTEIRRTYRIEPEFTVQVMGSPYDIIIPDQDRTKMPLGILSCTRPDRPYLPNASCALKFDRDGQSWKITFGRQYLHRYAEFREKATALLDQFKAEEQ